MFQGILYCVVFLFCAGILAKVRSRRVRQAVLLIASYGLYLTWGRWFGAVLVTSTVLNFLLGQGLRRKPSGAILGLGICVNLLLLGAFSICRKWRCISRLLRYNTSPISRCLWDFRSGRSKQ